MSRPRIYCAGSISGQSLNGATSWYDDLARAIPEAELLRPLRGVRSARKNANAERLEAEQVGERCFVLRDEWDVVRRADMIFANVLVGDEQGKVSIGTVCEISLAHAAGTLIVLVGKKGGVHDHAFLKRFAWTFVHTFEDGVAATRSALNLETVAA